MSFRWLPGKTPTDVWPQKLDQFKRQLKSGLILIFELHAVQIEADMKQNARWEDQTGQARQTLKAFVYDKDEQVVLVAKQHVDYGKWLELKNGGRFAIVLETLEQHYGEVWDDVREAIE